MNDNTTFDQLPKELEKFQESMCKKYGSMSCNHNMYHIKLEDLSGNVEDYFGMNVMTNYYFDEVGYSGNGINSSVWKYVWIGNGIDASHQPSRDNKIMFNPIVKSSNILTTADKDSMYPVRYNATTGDVTQPYLINETVYDYNISGINEDIECNEIGFGPAYNNLYSHSKIYDGNGNEITITKKINQKMTIRFLWVVTINKSVYETMWSNGLYGGFMPYIFIHQYLYSERTIYQILARSSGMFTQTYENRGNYYVDGSRKIFSNGKSVIVKQDDDRTMTTNPPTYIMQHSRFDYFDKTALSLSLEWRSAIISTYSDMQLCKPYKLSTPETIETIVKTWRYDKTDFYHTLGIDAYVNEGSYIRESKSRLRGFLPVTDMNIQSIYRYNFATSEWDVPETFNNPYDNQYDYYQFFHAFRVWIKWPDNVTRYAYVFTNPHYQQRAIVKFNNSGFTCYATDTWWDVSSWALIQNTQLIDASLQNKKFYICDKAPTGYSSGPWVGSESGTRDLWWPYPEFEYANGIHEIDASFSPYIDEVSAMDFYMSSGYVFMHVDETNGFYIQNFLVVRKVEENASIVPSIYVQQNVVSLMQGSFYEGYIGNVIYTDDGKMIHTLNRHRFDRYHDSYVTSGVHLFITDLSLPVNEINQSTQYIDTTTTFTDAQVSINGNYQIHSISNYIVIKMTNNGDHNQAVVVNTSTNTCELMPFRVNQIRKRFGTKHIVCDPSNELNKWTIYDIENKEIVNEFEIPSDYVTSTYFAFEDWVYIKCKYGSNDAMLLHTISTNTTEQISFPAELFNTNTSYGGFSYGTCNSSYKSSFDYPSDYYNLSSLYPNRIQYKDGICVLNSAYPNYVNGKIMVISRYNPKHIIAQSVIGDYSFSSSNRYESAICLSKIYENYYLSFTMDYSDYGIWCYSKLVDIGRLVREDAEVSDTSSIEYLVDYAPYIRDGMDGTQRMFIPYKNKIYVYENNSNYNVLVLPPEGFITHKLTFTTKTCCRWNNPKQITYPTIQITLTNNV